MPRRPNPSSPNTHGRSEIWDRRAVATAIRQLTRRVAQRVRALRHERGLTIATAAEMVGIHDKALARIELGQVVPTLPTLVAIARAYRVSVADLLA